MSSLRLLPVLLAVLATSFSVAVDEDFAFDVSDDLEVEFPSEPLKKQWSVNEMVATVGRVFQFTVPKGAFDGKTITKYVARASNGDLLPNWLLFEKTSGVFWGVPLSDDIQTLDISIRGVLPSETDPLNFKLTVKDSKEPPSNLQKCTENEDSTILVLLIDKDIKTIKPKQRVIAINNIAKFFGLPHSAFMFTEDQSSDDGTDNSVILTGSGNLEKQKSKLTSAIKVPVGCDGRLWLNITPLIHQLKKQAKDGTISEVLKLPLLGWKIKIDTVPDKRQKRYVDDNGGPVGSGDYEDDYNYDDYEEYDDSESEIGEEEPREEIPTETPPIITKPSDKTTVVTKPSEISTTTVRSETHPHRHHHGEIRPIEDIEPSIQVVVEPTVVQTPPTSSTTEEATEKVSEEYSTLKQTTDYVTQKSTTQIKQTQETTTPSTTSTGIYTSEEFITENEEPITRKTNLYRPADLQPDEEDDYGEDYDDEEGDNDDDDEESETEVPVLQTDGVDTVNRVTEKAESTSAESTATEVANIHPQTDSVQFAPETTSQFSTTVRESVIPIQEVPTEGAAPPTTSTESTTPPKSTAVLVDTTLVEEDTTTSSKHTTQRHTTVTLPSSTQTVVTTTPTTASTQHVTENIIYEVKNFPPTIQKRLNNIAITAGKVFTYFVPLNTFTDMEDGNNLTLEFLDNEGKPVDKNSWCQFNPRTREIYGLPVEEDVSGWEYILKATDSEGASVSDRLKIRVQHHKSRRVVNHEFSLHLIVEKKYEFPNTIDWALRTLRGLGSIYGVSNLTEITVRKLEYNKEPAVFTWTNDSLPKSYCPRAEIEKLYSMLTANDRGDPSKILSLSLAPEIKVKKVTYQGLGICEAQPPPPALPPTNFSPILRNAVDHINATIGELLVYTVPDDTFYDPEDVDARNLKMSLLTIDRRPISPDNWLQFDSKNKEFYGIPLPKDVGRSEYVLVCEDSGGLTASDSLVVVVHAAPRVNYNVEFSMTVETDYETFATSPNMQRKFIEKLRDLFEDRDTSNIHLSSISKGSTIVSWYNKSLSTSHCPRDEIKRLEAILVNSDRTINSRVQDVMDPEFPVSAIKLQPLGNCKSRTVSAQIPLVPLIPDEAAQESHEEYLITFIVPAVIIAAMLLLAGIAACVLYRRRRSGKMNVEEDGRQSYGNKGIPVIFQEELEEKPDPGTKNPVILKDEKPPLAPPEYSKSGSLKLNDDSEPYHPPPPFTRTQDNGKQSRPKPTPTYRKPPPYVPP